MKPRSASAALMPLDEALRRLLDEVAPVAPVTRAVGASLGTVAARDLIAPADVPSRATALRDGRAVDAEAVVGASAYAPVVLASPPPWVEAGGAMPDGTETVLAADAFEGAFEGACEVVADAPSGEGVRGAGDEIGRGDTLVAAGTRLTALHALALAAAGIDEIAVRVPRIRLVATGADGAARAVCSLIAALAAATGAGTAGITDSPDDPDAVAHAIGAETADAVFVVGGTGFGRTDRSAEGLARAGSLAAHGLALRPGETAGFGTARGRPVLLVPGRPDAALAVFLALGRPLLARLSGAEPLPPSQALLSRKIVATIGVSEVVFVRRGPAGVEPLGGADLPLRRLMLADGAILAPPDREGYPEGTPVEIMSL